MRVLVAGSEGSLMQAVIPGLIASGHTIVGADSLFRHGQASEGANRDYEFHNLDLTDFEGVRRLMSLKFDGVIQAAARIFGVGGFNRYRADILGEDVTLHNNVLKGCVGAGVSRIIYISSSMVYETCVQDLAQPVREEFVDDCVTPRTDYGLSKLVGERLTKAFHNQYGLEYTIWRPFNIITPYETSEGSDPGVSHVFADFIKNVVIERKNPLPIIGDGNQVRCFTWIGDVAEAIANFSFVDASRGQTLNLGNPEPYSMGRLAAEIANTAHRLGMLPYDGDELGFVTVAEYENDVRIRVPAVSKAKEVLNWQAKVPTAVSVERCLSVLGDDGAVSGL